MHRVTQAGINVWLVPVERLEPAEYRCRGSYWYITKDEVQRTAGMKNAMQYRGTYAIAGSAISGIEILRI